MSTTVPTSTDLQANPRQGGDDIIFLQIPRAYYDYIIGRNKKSRLLYDKILIIKRCHLTVRDCDKRRRTEDE